MDLLPGPGVRAGLGHGENVSILVLMDLLPGLRYTRLTIISLANRFNPCFNGSASRTVCPEAKNEFFRQVSILVLMDLLPGPFPSHRGIPGFSVSILVLMDLLPGPA